MTPEEITIKIKAINVALLISSRHGNDLWELKMNMFDEYKKLTGKEY